MGGPQKGKTALMAAVLAGNTNIVNQLIEKNATAIGQVSRFGMKALDFCFMTVDPYEYDSTIATLLIENNLSDVNRIVNLPHLWTPLFYAVIQNDENLVKLLVKNGANTKHTDKNGKSASYYAEKKNFTNIVHLLQPSVKHAHVRKILLWLALILIFFLHLVWEIFFIE